MMKRKPQILVVEDEALVARFLSMRLASFGYEVAGNASQGRQAIELAVSTKPDLILMDIMLDGEMTGLEAAGHILNQLDVPIIFLTAYSDDDTLKKAKAASPYGYLVKPLQERELYCMIEITHHKHQSDLQIKEKNRQLRQANDELQQLDKLKSQFTSAISHELKTPLTVILSSLHMLIDGAYGDIPPEQKEILDLAATHSKQLQRLVEDVLDFSLLEAGRFKLQLAKECIKETVEQAIDARRVVASEKGITIHCELPSQLPPLYFDKARITKVMDNLIANALKFTGEKGQISITACARENSRTASQEVFVSVQDSGIGINQGSLPLVFKKYSQIDSSDTRKYGGTGLGLAISKGIVEAHEGKIWVESTPNQGSTFSFTLPINQKALSI